MTPMSSFFSHSFLNKLSKTRNSFKLSFFGPILCWFQSLGKISGVQKFAFSVGKRYLDVPCKPKRESAFISSLFSVIFLPRHPLTFSFWARANYPGYCSHYIFIIETYISRATCSGMRFRFKRGLGFGFSFALF